MAFSRPLKICRMDDTWIRKDTWTGLPTEATLSFEGFVVLRKILIDELGLWIVGIESRIMFV